MVAALISTLGGCGAGVGGGTFARCGQGSWPQTHVSQQLAAAGSDPQAREGRHVGAEWRRLLDSALLRGIRAAERQGGVASAGIWVDSWSRPVLQGAIERCARMWSVSKVVTSLAAMSLGADGDPFVRRAMVDAITRSDNCAQRRVVLALRKLAGSQAAEVSDVTKVLARAHVTPTGAYEVGAITDDRDCIPYLEATRGTLADPLQPALEFGTLTWSVSDAVSFAHALATHVYGRAGAAMLRLMRLPKRYALQPASRQDYTSPLDRPPSGGDFPSAWRPGYKGGWGGSEQADFVTEEIAVLDIHGHSVALAADFWPSTPASSDDPGRGIAPDALEALFTPVRAVLKPIAHQMAGGAR